MALKAVLASLEGINEALQAEYTQGEDGRFYINVEGVDDMPAVAGLKKKNAELLDKSVKYKQQLDAYGATPEEVAALRESAGKDSGKRVQELEDKLAKASEAAQREIQLAKEEAKAERDAARMYFEDGEINRAIGGAKGVPELLSHVVRQHIKSERGDDGKFALKVLGKDGQARIKDSAGNPYSLDDLVMELKADPKYGRAFEPEGKGGSGAEPSGGGSGGGGGKTIRAGDREAFGANLEAIAKGEVTVV